MYMHESIESLISFERSFRYRDSKFCRACRCGATKLQCDIAVTNFETAYPVPAKLTSHNRIPSTARTSSQKNQISPGCDRARYFPQVCQEAEKKTSWRVCCTSHIENLWKTPPVIVLVIFPYALQKRSTGKWRIPIRSKCQSEHLEAALLAILDSALSAWGSPLNNRLLVYQECSGYMESKFLRLHRRRLNVCGLSTLLQGRARY